ALLRLGRLYAQSQCWRKGPRILVNSIPKAGTHLLVSELSRVTDLQNSYVHIENRRINALSRRNERVSRFQLNASALRRQLSKIRQGQFFTARMSFSDEALCVLTEEKIRTILVIRHPLDILVSQYHYIMGLKRHHHHYHL